MSCFYDMADSLLDWMIWQIPIGQIARIGY